VGSLPVADYELLSLQSYVFFPPDIAASLSSAIAFILAFLLPPILGPFLSSTLPPTIVGAGFRIGANFAPRPVNDPAWYHSRACFYCFNFVVEIIVIYMYAFVRVDRRFHVPDGASGRHNYGPAEGKVETRIVSEDEFLDDFRPMEEGAKDEENGNGNALASNGAEATGPANWEKRAEKELENGMQEPPVARVA